MLHKSNLRVNAVQTISLLKRLIRIPSVNPAIENGTGENAIASFIADWCRRTHQFEVHEQHVIKDRFNVIVILPGKSNGKSLILNGHMDTVGTSGMTTRPFTTAIERGRIHGRGTCDMKGSLAAMMSTLLTLAKSKQKRRGDVLFTAVVDEEYKSIGTSKLINRFGADAAIVGEPTNLDIAVADKGYAWLEIETFGRRAHGSMPEKGVDAIEKMAKIISRLDEVRQQHERRKHFLVGTPNIHTSKIVGGTDWSSIPATCTLQLERRLIPGETQRDAVNEIERIIAAVSKLDDKTNATVRLIHYADGMEVKNPPHLSTLQKQARILGAPGRVVGVPYWADASILVNQAKIPTCLFGPGNITVAHSPDEYVRIVDVVKAADIYAQTAQLYCNNES